MCIIASAWFGGAGPGLLAAVLATLALPRLIEMSYPLTAGLFDLPRFLAFTITGLTVGWGTTLWRRAETARRLNEHELRAARNELEIKVREQTADLRRSEALLAEAERLSQTGSFGWWPATGEAAWSAETFRIFDYDETTKPTAEHVFARVHPDDAALVRDILARAARDARDFEHEYRLLMLDGSTKHVHTVAHARRDARANLEFVGAVMDITGRRRAEEAARKAQGELAHVTRVMTIGELTASIAHEVNQPLSAIVNDAQASLNWLAASAPDLDKARESITNIIRDGIRASDIIKRIRALVQKAETEKARLDLNDAVREVLVLAEGEARRHRVTLRADLAARLPAVVGDRVQLEQVILNLVVNGVEAMALVTDRPRQLLVRSRPHERDRVLVAVQDAGSGIDPGNLGRIFETFYTTKAQGMGMGLAICRSIVEGHGGTLRAIPNDGPGMTFEVTLPASI